MADESHRKILEQGVEAWNSWRTWNSSIVPDLSGADLFRPNLRKADLSEANLHEAYLHEAGLTEANLHEARLTGADLTDADLTDAVLYEAVLFEARLRRANLRRARLSEANLHEARLTYADLTEANLPGANLSGAYLINTNLARANLRGANLFRARLSRANLRGANLPEANLYRCELTKTDLTGADLSNADLRRSSLVEAILERATLEGCRVYGISAWGLKLKGAKQENLNVSREREPAITVDNLEVAQFIYLLLNNERIRHVIDTITSKVVLILGRFTSERKALLEAIRDSLRQHDYLPVLFDFEGPTSRDLIDTVSTLAHMARFIIADITDAKSVPQELQAIVPDLAVPVQPLLLSTDHEYGMFESFRRYPWVLETFYYDDPDELLASIDAKVISPAETKAKELSK
jgi:uncharacterized protein YjbI with pentapeptide repeats